MSSEPIACRLRILQSKSGLSQRELAKILGFAGEVAVSRHARSATIPNLLTALGYEVIFREQISDIFPGLYHTVEAAIEERLTNLENELQQSTVKGRPAVVIARKLEFLYERKDVESDQAAV